MRCALLLLLVACSGEPALPSLQLRALMPELRQEVEALPPAPAEAEQRELRDLVETAFVPGMADERLAVRARESLRGMPGARWALEQALAHEHAAVRSFAAFELGKLGQRASLPVLLLRLKYEQEAEPLCWVADALDALGNRAGLEHLVTLIRAGTQAEVAGQRAVEVLRRAKALGAENPSWDELLQGLGRMIRSWRERGGVPQAIPPEASDHALLQGRIAERLVLLEGFQLRPVDDSRFILARLGSLAMPQLVRALAASEHYLRSHALEVVIQLGPVAAELARTPVLALLQDPLSRSSAVTALGTMHATDTYPFVARLLERPDLELRVAVAGALGPLGDRVAIPLLQRLLHDEAELIDVRVQAAFSLAWFELDRPGLQFLRERLRLRDYHPPTIQELLARIDAEAQWR